jgi:hypothetical protein
VGLSPSLSSSLSLSRFLPGVAIPQHGFKETGVVNIAEPVMFELKGDEDTKEAQQSTKGVTTNVIKVARS